MIENASRDAVKRAAALSVLAALFLALAKLIVGILSNSIGIISEALHSGLDFVAAGITFIAVRSASKEPDEDHQFGHGKIENFSALVETIILWITCIWIAWEALRRIQFQEWAEPTLVGIGLMALGILVDYERSRMLYKTAVEHNSQALEADALHFSTDMLSSAVVLVGLGFVWFGFPLADPLAALGVCLVILVVSYRLARRAFDALIDRAPEGIYKEIQEVCESVPGVLNCKMARTRVSGHHTFMNVVISVSRNASVDEAHNIADSVEFALSKLGTNVDVMVHIEPSGKKDQASEEISAYNILRDLVKLHPEVIGVHNIRIHVSHQKMHIAADLEMHSALTLGEAHDVSDHIEKGLAERIPRLEKVTFHLEDGEPQDQIIDVTALHNELAEEIKQLVESETPARDCHGVVITDDNTGLTVSLDCRVDPTMPLGKSHNIAELVESTIKSSFNNVTKVFVHIEPE